MQTHQLADFLETLVQALRASPDADLAALLAQLGVEMPRRVRSAGSRTARLSPESSPPPAADELRKMSRDELLACLKNPRNFRTKGDLVALGRSCEIAVNEKMKREEIVERIVRQLYDLPRGREILGSFPAG